MSTQMTQNINAQYEACLSEIKEAQARLKIAEDKLAELVIEQASATELHKDLVLWEIKGLKTYIITLKQTIKVKTAQSAQICREIKNRTR